MMPTDRGPWASAVGLAWVGPATVLRGLERHALSDRPSAWWAGRSNRSAALRGRI